MSEVVMNGNETVLRVSDGDCVSEIKVVGGNLYLTAGKIEIEDGD